MLSSKCGLRYWPAIRLSIAPIQVPLDATLTHSCRAFLVELLPILLLGLTDEVPSIRDATMRRIEQIGQQHAALQASRTSALQ